MTYTSEQIQKAAKVAMFNTAESARLDAELTAELGTKGKERLLNSPEVERACNALESESDDKPSSTPDVTAPAAARDKPDDCDLLPFDIYDPKLGDTVPAAGYLIDQFCRPHGVRRSPQKARTSSPSASLGKPKRKGSAFLQRLPTNASWPPKAGY